MERYIVDTNIAVHYARNGKVWAYIEEHYFPKGLKNRLVLSFAAKTEAISFSKANNWGARKIGRLQHLFKQAEIIHSNHYKLSDAYVNIDLYSRNKHKSLRLPSTYTARNMGKNDIWIASTAMALKHPLISTDKDFEHLDGVFIDLIYIDVEVIMRG
ncbi:MAG: PIN domain-containing protein [Bacteroidota bacterium]